MSILSEQGTGPRSKLPMHLQRAVTLLAMSRIPSSARKIKGVVDVSIQRKTITVDNCTRRRKRPFEIEFSFIFILFYQFSNSFFRVLNTQICMKTQISAIFSVVKHRLQK
jgi:hypothetical protein